MNFIKLYQEEYLGERINRESFQSSIGKLIVIF